MTYDEDAVRAEIREWLAQHWDPELSLAAWRIRLADSGWAAPTWPAQWGGRSLPAAAAQVVADELARAGSVGPPDGVGMHLAAPTILEHGPDDLRRRFLRPSLTGEVVWCQLFSEPGAGSDLAGLTTRAELDGDEWVVTGQKVWNTGAAQADLGLLLARTDWDAPKHRGITYLVLPMRQPGVEVRPLRQMNGHRSFNEVFIDGARVPAANVVGAVGDGWQAALTTLAHERRLAPTPLPSAGGRPPAGRAAREAAAERVAASEPHRWYPQRAGRVDLVVDRARATGADADPLVRQELARLLSLARSARWMSQRAAAARALGRPPGPEGSLGKLASSHIARAASRVHGMIAGSSGMLSGADDPTGGIVAEVLVSVPAISIAGGTDEIQRNILAERVLGLPREPAVDRDVPFRQVLTNARTSAPGR
jgi:alkylation response protein AidB-like acyl-CoA dehydrogenase